MALPTKQQMANRFGLDVEVFQYGDDILTEDPLVVIDFANSCEIVLDAERVWATGYQDHSRRVGFHNAIQGNLTISTQLITCDVLSLLAGKKPTPGTNIIVFDNVPNRPLVYFTLRGKTVWQEADGSTHSETITFCKATPRLALNITYGGDGDPQSCDLIFDLMANDAGKAIRIVRDHESALLIDSNGYQLMDSNGFILYAPVID